MPCGIAQPTGLFRAYVWNEWKNEGKLVKTLEAEAYITELIIPHKNIHLFSFNNRTDITTDINHYTDGWHYAAWINSLILKWMHDGKYQLTTENYKAYLDQEYDFYTNYDYLSINNQPDYDYEADSYAGALLNVELTGAEPKKFAETEFIVDLDEGYNYLCFIAKPIDDTNNPVVSVFDETGELIKNVNFPELDTDIHLFAVDLSTESGIVTVALNSSDYTINEVYMY